MGGLFGGSASSTTTTRFTSLQVQTSSAGVAKSVMWGQRRAAPNLVWANNLQSKASSSGGGKGGGSSSGYTYTIAVVMALCEGPTTTIGRVWANKDDTTLAKLGLTFMPGTDGQQAVTAIYASAPAEALAYPFTAYVGTATYDLGSSASLPNHNFEVQSWLHNAPNTMDAQWPDILTDFLTNERYGARLAADYIGDLSSWRGYCAALGFYGSPLLDSQETGIDIINRWAQLTNTAIFWSGSVIKALPLGDQAVSGTDGSWDPGTSIVPQYDLTSDDFIADANADPITGSVKDPADTYNYGQLTYCDRTNSYQDDVATAFIQAAIDADQLRPMDTVTGRELCDVNTATLSMQLQLQRACYVTNTYAWKTGIQYRLLEPGDVVTLTDDRMGLDKFPVRITKTTNNADRSIDFEAEELPAGVGTATAHPRTTTDTAAINTSVDPGDVTQVVITEPSPGLSGGVQQVWIGAAGGTWWGGASVRISLDDEKYERIGELEGPCRVGVLATDLPAAADPDTTNQPQVTLASARLDLGTGDQADADAGRTLCLIGNEMISYATATLVAANTYRLSYVRRGLYGTTITDHPAGTAFARLDDKLFAYDLPSAYIGQRLYIKLTSFNIFESAEYSEADVDAYTYTPVGAAGMLPAPTRLTLAIETAFQADGTVQPGIRANWTAADAGMATDTVVRFGAVSAGGVSSWQTVTVAAGTTTTLLTPVTQTLTYAVQAASSISADVRSVWAPTTAATITVGGVLAGATITNLELYGQGLDTTFVTRDIHITWQGNFPSTSYALGSEPNGTGSGFVNPYFADYVVEVYDPDTDALLRTERVTASEYIYTYDKNAGDAGGPHRTVKFSVRMEDKLGGLTDPPATLTVTNPPPAQVQITPLGISGGSVLLGFIAPGDVDYAGVNAWIGTTADVDTSGTPAVSGYSAPLVAAGLTAGQQYYGKVQTYDAFGSAGCPISAAFTWTEPYVTAAQLAEKIIDDTKLTDDLAGTIDLITDPATVVGSVAYQVAQEAAARGAAIQTVQTAIGNVATNVTSLAAVVNDASTGLAATRAQVTDFEQAQATTNTATANSISTLTAQVNDPATGLPATLAAVQANQSAQAGVNTATASSISTLQTTVGANTASIETLATSVDGVEGEYTVKIETDSGGVPYVAGFGLINNGPGTSQFIVRADTFAIIPPGATVAQAPFVVGTVDGAYIVSINHAFIQNLDASVITTGTFGADVVYAGTLSADNITGGSIAGKDIYTATGGPRLLMHGSDDGNGYGPYWGASDGTRWRVLIGRLANDWGINVTDSAGRTLFDTNDLGTGVASNMQSVSANMDGSTILASDKGAWTTLCTLPAFQVRGNACDVRVSFSASIVSTSGTTATNVNVRVLRTNVRTSATEVIGLSLTAAPYQGFATDPAFTDTSLDQYTYALQAYRPADIAGGGDTGGTITYQYWQYYNLFLQVRWFR
ncbi:MAG: phage tail protein [Azospirillaceae bacterium]|nr:phage tail protein [Azospirillaceae bacterium]